MRELKEEVKELIPEFYATGADEQFQKLQELFQDRWESEGIIDSENTEKRLQAALDEIRDDIKFQQDIAAEIRLEIENEEQKIENPEIYVPDEDLQKRMNEQVAEQIQAKLKARIEKEDQQRKWLLEEVLKPNIFNNFTW